MQITDEELESWDKLVSAGFSLYSDNAQRLITEIRVLRKVAEYAAEGFGIPVAAVIEIARTVNEARSSLDSQT